MTILKVILTRHTISGCREAILPELAKLTVQQFQSVGSLITKAKLLAKGSFRNFVIFFRKIFLERAPGFSKSKVYWSICKKNFPKILMNSTSNNIQQGTMVLMKVIWPLVALRCPRVVIPDRIGQFLACRKTFQCSVCMLGLVGQVQL